MGEIDFVVLKINGVSVQDFSEDEAVQAFLKNNKPIQVEVQQLQTTSNSSSIEADNISNASLVLTLRCLTISSGRSTQTQETQTTEFPTHEINDFICQENDAAVNASIVAENNERLIEEEHVLFDQCLAPEIDIEEVTLRKSTSNELLGLSIIYSGADSGSKTNSGGSNNGVGSSSENNNDVCTEVYISHIQKDSVAGRDGRLRQGDQILQINGKDIKTKEETETLIAENNNAVTLLVSRYLYTDEDDFNDPSLVVDLEEEEVGDENDETDDEEGDELYVDNNSAYENCLTNDNMHLVTNLDRVFIAQEKNRNLNDKTIEKSAIETNVGGVKVISMRKSASDKIDDANNLKMMTAEKGQIVCKSYQKDNLCSDTSTSVRSKKLHSTQESHKNSEIVISTKFCNDIDPTSVIDSDTEHIYETIPEDSEPEPFYCSPYESSTYVNAVGTCSSSTSTNGGVFHLQQRQKQRVAQWLGLCGTTSSNTTLFPRRTIPMRSRNFAAPKDLLGRCANKSDTVRSIITVTTNGSSSSGGGVEAIGLTNHQEEQDNSSSAYNTGGSNTSANQPRNEAMFSSKTLQEETLNTPLAMSGIKRLQFPKDKERINSKTAGVGTHGPNKTYCATRTGCEELSIPDTLIRMYPPLTTSQSADKKHFNKETSPQNCNKAQFAHADHLPRAVSMLCPHFTAPNLRQYRFVSSQEVSALQPGTIITDTAKRIQQESNQQQQQPSMVWKVKRRPDGTRYIVRRPAVTVITGAEPALTFSSRSRGLRNLEHARNDATTTEDDTISEVKTGRYWSKEERKKHVEKARERRLQQQQQLEQQMLDGTMCISEKMIARLQQHRKNRQKYQMLKVQHQDLQFGGIVNQKTKAPTGTTCDLQPLLTTKQQPTTAKSNYLAQQHQFILSPNDDLAANTIPVEENDFSENCSSP